MGTKETPTVPCDDDALVAPSHVVQFYEDDAYLCDTVARFIGAGIAAGDPVLVFATDLHRQAFVQRLKLNHIDVAAAIAGGRLALHDARDALDRFMSGDLPDWERFVATIGSSIEAVAGDGAHVRAYGEMVDLLWREGNAPAAIQLEEMWNRLRERDPRVSLLCAYVMDNFYKADDAQRFHEVCRAHAGVVPADSYSKIEDPQARLREISALQQRSRALKNEVERRKQAEVRLAQLLAEETRKGGEKEAHLRLLVDSIGDYALFMLDPKGRVSSWNVGAERIKGYRADEIIGQHFSRFHPVEEAQAGKCERVLEVAAQAGRFEEEGWRVRKDGSRFWAHVIVTSVLDERGALIGFAKVTRDLTERRKLERERIAHAAAVAERDRLHELFLRAPVAIALSRGPVHRIELANPALCALFGRGAGDLVGKTVGDAFCELSPTLATLVDEVFRTGAGFVTPEYPAKVLRDALPVDAVLRFSLEPLKDSAGIVYGVMTVAIDLTEQVHAREALEWALAEQRKTDELREQLVGVVGHDLRAPLHSITITASLMMKRGALPDSEVKSVALIARNADRMSKMISQLLDFTRSRLGGGIPIAPEPIDLTDLCADLIAESEAAHPDRTFRFASDVGVRGMWDPDRLGQLVANLLGNAVQHGSSDGPIALRLHNEGGGVSLAVHNEGVPIPADLLSSIFEPFRRGTREPGGRTESLGLGLYIVREIARAHGGEVSAESSEAGGTTFAVRLPRTSPSTPPTPSRSGSPRRRGA
jgi:PAS domain S-box-containing protein